MKIKKDELLQVLNEVKLGVTSKSLITQMANVMFTGSEVITYNEQIGVCHPFKTDFVASINHNDLLGVVNKIKEDEFEMELVENEVQISSKKTRAGLVVSLEEKLVASLEGLLNQLPSSENNLEWIDIPSDFMSGALLCIPSASKDMGLGVLTCLYAHDKDLICTDNKRVSWYEMDSSLNAEFFVKANILKELAQFEFKKMSISESWINFKTGNNTVFSTRLVRGKSLGYFKKLFEGFTGTAIELPEGLKEVIDGASVMSQDDEHRDIWITFDADKIVCATQSNRGWIEKELDIEFKSEAPLQFMVSATALQQILGMKLKTIVGDNKSYFESGNFKHVLLHRMNND